MGFRRTVSATGEIHAAIISCLSAAAAVELVLTVAQPTHAHCNDSVNCPLSPGPQYKFTWKARARLLGPLRSTMTQRPLPRASPVGPPVTNTTFLAGGTITEADDDAGLGATQTPADFPTGLGGLDGETETAFEPNIPEADPLQPSVPLRKTRQREAKTSLKKRTRGGNTSRIVAAGLLLTAVSLLALKAGKKFLADSEKLQGVSEPARPLTAKDARKQVAKALRKVTGLLDEEFYEGYIHSDNGNALASVLDDIDLIDESVRPNGLTGEEYGVAAERANALAAEVMWKGALWQFQKMQEFLKDVAETPITRQQRDWSLKVLNMIDANALRLISHVRNMQALQPGGHHRRWGKAKREAEAVTRWVSQMRSVIKSSPN
ncbi:hypothetical protein CSUI_008351 [Cystoisospora suis]|uniref:Transmembrane protein n=1 Tax=Cystoisospora suis TaxID=483139 RepID=A0A2C6KMU9_9APIC|nr:hypothetical protein CSUI_008351 [Cystoisospora suis]